MLRLKNIIQVGDWDIVNNNLFVVQNNKINKLDLLGKYISNIYTLDKYWGANYYNDFIHIFTMHSENTIIDYNGKLIFKKDNFNFHYFFNVRKFIGFDRKIKKIVLCLENEKKILHNERVGTKKVILSFFVFCNKQNNVLFFTDLDHLKQPLWKFDLNQLGTFVNLNKEQKEYNVEKILGVHNEHLYIALNGSRILELDIKTGKLTFQWHHLPDKYKIHPSDDFAGRFFALDKVNNSLICLAGERYDIIDLQSKVYSSINIIGELKKFDIVSLRYQGDFNNNHISAIAHLNNKFWFQDGIVMFNRKTKKIDWFYKDDNFTTGSDIPKLSNNKLYQLDNNNILHIFEKA